MSADWEDIGPFLDISEGVLKIIKADHPGNVRKCFRVMLREWLKQVEPPPMWSTIIDAIELLGNEALAENLRVKYT